MKSNGPCFPPPRFRPPPLPSPAIGVLLPFLPLPPRFGVPLWIRAPPVIAGEGDMRLVPKTLPFPSPLSSSLLPPVVPFSHPCFLDTLARYQPSSLYSANVFPIFLLRSTCAFASDRSDPLSPHLHAVMHPLLVFPALSSALIPFCRVGWFHRFFPIEIDACLLASLSPRVLYPVELPLVSLFVLPPNPFLSIFLFEVPSPAGYMPDFRCRCRFSSACASMRRYLDASAYQFVVPFFPALPCPVCHPIPCPHDSFVTIGIPMLLPCLASHIS